MQKETGRQAASHPPTHLPLSLPAHAHIHMQERALPGCSKFPQVYEFWTLPRPSVVTQISVPGFGWCGFIASCLYVDQKRTDAQESARQCLGLNGKRTICSSHACTLIFAATFERLQLS